MLKHFAVVAGSGKKTEVVKGWRDGGVWAGQRGRGEQRPRTRGTDLVASVLCKWLTSQAGSIDCVWT